MEFDEAIPDAYAEDFIVALIGEYFGNIAAIDDKTLRENVVLGCENGFSEEDRSVRTGSLMRLRLMNCTADLVWSSITVQRRRLTW